MTWTRSNLAGFSFEAGIEGVLNTLDSSTEFSTSAPTGEQDP